MLTCSIICIQMRRRQRRREKGNKNPEGPELYFWTCLLTDKFAERKQLQYSTQLLKNYNNFSTNLVRENRLSIKHRRQALDVSKPCN